MLPPFVYDLIAAVQRYEQEHGEASMCFDGVLYAVPAEEQHAARVLAAYKLAHERPAPSPMQADTATADGEVPRPTRCRCSLTPVIDPESLRIAAGDPYRTVAISPATVAVDGGAVAIEERLCRALRRAKAYNQRYGYGAVTACRLNAPTADKFGIVANIGSLLVEDTEIVIAISDKVPNDYARVYSDGTSWRDLHLELPSLLTAED